MRHTYIQMLAVIKNTLKRIVLIYILSSLLHFAYGQDSTYIVIDDYGTIDWVINDSAYRIQLKDTIFDYDGNPYNTQKIGDQYWMVQNLKTTHFNNGNSIQLLNDSSDWVKTHTGAYCNATSVIYYAECDTCITKKIYGKTNQLFYNQFVVLDDRNVCPVGWHIPDVKDWRTLINQVEKIWTEVFQNKMQKWSAWETKNGLGFAELPYGYRSGSDGDFYLYNTGGFWWMTTENKGAGSGARPLFYDDIYLVDKQFETRDGLSIKCIKDNYR